MHCGWRGLAQDILCKTCGKIEDNWGKGLDDLLVYIGAGICGDCYKIHDERVGKFSDYPEAVNYRDQNIYIDLKKVAQKQLLASRVKKENIKTSPECTAELSHKYFSYWRQGDPVKRMLAAVGMER